MKPTHYLFFCLLCLFSFSAYCQNHSWTPDKRLEDINYLSDQVTKTFPNYNGNIKDNFEKGKLALVDKLNTLDTRQTVIGIRKLLATIQDEGNNFSVFQSAVGFKVLPLKTLLLDDGLIICDAHESNGQLIGKKISAINGVPVETIKKRLSLLTPKDNQHYLDYVFPLYVITPELWMEEALPNECVVELTDGSIQNIALEPLASYAALSRDLPSHRKSPFEDREYLGRNYWYEYNNNSKTLFIQFLGIYKNDNDPSFGKFVKAIEQELDKSNIDKVIIDNRYGGGGNGFALKPFTDLMAKHPKPSKRGKLFVLTNNSTRGTIAELTSILELNTKAILVGKSTGEGPNSVGDTKVITLPNSGINVTLTHTLWNTSWENDQRKTISPYVEVEYTSEDYINHVDPWLEAVNKLKINNTPQLSSFQEELVGTYNFEGRKITISTDNGALKMTMNRKMKSFFEINTSLYPLKEGKLSTDIKDVYLLYKMEGGKATITSIDWKGVTIARE